MSLADSYTAKELADELEACRDHLKKCREEKVIAERTLCTIAAGKWTKIGSQTEARKALIKMKEVN